MHKFCFNQKIYIRLGFQLFGLQKLYCIGLIYSSDIYISAIWHHNDLCGDGFPTPACFLLYLCSTQSNVVQISINYLEVMFFFLWYLGTFVNMLHFNMCGIIMFNMYFYIIYVYILSFGMQYRECNDFL